MNSRIKGQSAHMISSILNSNETRGAIAALSSLAQADTFTGRRHRVT